ncbi:hypothetical protein H8356DRAFT_1353564 [Neocallimastix lanati (nom. inval.)]|nr:hypothetical protein H8356DRAFT_1353564 [Neocallimastix sp. JGI-2020a]
MLNDYKKERTLPPHKINVKLVRPNKNVTSKIICKYKLPMKGQNKLQTRFLYKQKIKFKGEC